MRVPRSPFRIARALFVTAPLATTSAAAATKKRLLSRRRSEIGDRGR